MVKLYGGLVKPKCQLFYNKTMMPLYYNETSPVKINYVSTNYMKMSILVNIIRSECSFTFITITFSRMPIKLVVNVWLC